MFMWLQLLRTVSMACAADLISAVLPLTSVPGMAETLASVSATPFWRPLGSAPVMGAK